MPNNIDITIAPSQGLKPRTTKGFRGSLKTKALWGLALALVFTSVALAAGYNCVPCKANYYCKKGVRYECPTERPVTFGTGAKSVDECHTCLERDGEIYPAYDIVTGDCVACWQMPETNTPYWNGTACSACPENTEWDSEGLTCKSSIPTATACSEDEDCVFKLPHNGETLYLVESVDYNTFTSISPQSAAEETPEFLAKYGIVNAAGSDYYPDRWAGAMKYCQDKGLRLPTMDELHSIANVVYGTNNTCTEACNNPNSQYVGAQTGCCGAFNSLTVANTELWNFLSSNSTATSVTDSFNLWSSAELSTSQASYRSFLRLRSYSTNSSRRYSLSRALCVR